MGYLKKYWKKYRVAFILGIISVVLETVCDVLQPRIMSLLVDNGALKGSIPEVWRYGLTMLGVAACGLLFALSRNYISSVTSKNFGAELRLDLYKKIQSLSSYGIDSFEEGSLVTRETNDVTQVENFVHGLMRILIKAPLICIGAVIMAASLSLKVMPIIIPIVIAVSAVIIISMKLAFPFFKKMQDAIDRLNTAVREYLVGIRLVKAFRRFHDEERRFDNTNNNLAEVTIQANRILAVFSPFMALFTHLGIAIILWLGAKWVDYGGIQIGQVMAFVSYMINILISLTIISNLLNTFVRVRASHRRISEVFATEPESIETNYFSPEKNIEKNNNNFSAHTEPSVYAAPHIELRGVGFRYRGSTGQPALNNISFSLKKGETLGIIGPTGSGKSTLAALLLRFYEPTAGVIVSGGAALPAISEAAWRERVAIVPQTPALFSGTIRENILWGKMTATDSEIDRALRDAQAYDFIMSNKDGIDREIGQSGAGLSGGQKQRVSIARALVREPELLVLDDCTSALDVMTEAAVKNALSGYSMTTILITQRVSTALGCDKILVLENGEMSGFGSHNELIDTCSVYRDIYRSQIGGERVG